jgi:hypothetical protein
MQTRKIAAFSLLAHINDNNIGLKSFDDIFIPLIKSALCKLNQSGIKSGQSISEIKNIIDTMFFLDIPIPLLKKFLLSISNEVIKNPDSQFVIHKDGSFQMNKFIFADYEEELLTKESEIEDVEKLYKTYLKSNNIDPETQPSIFDYIDQNRLALSKYFAYQQPTPLDIEYVHQANFINSVKPNKAVYEILRRVYLGSLISAYLEVDIGAPKSKVELLLDTNFIIGILDLNSPEATHTCRKIIEICDRLGYTKSVLPFTLEETELLIERKALLLENAFFQGYLDPESIYNAVRRRGISKTQLQQIGNNLKHILVEEYKINLIGNDDRFRNLARYQYSDIYEFYKNLRGSVGFSALHDTTAIAYVKEKRAKVIKGDVLKANCWFVTNTPYNLKMPDTKGYLPEIIRAEEILNILWLTNPNVTTLISSSELSTLGLTRIVSSTISYSLPSPKVLRDLDENFNAYAGSTITADDAVMVASMIARKKINNPETLNRLASGDSDNFISAVKEYADRGRKEEKELNEKLKKIIDLAFSKINTRVEEKPIQQEVVGNTENTVSEKEYELVLRKNLLLTRIIALAGFTLLSFLWWQFESIFNVSFIQPGARYFFYKLIGQLFMITATLALTTKTYRAAWITTSVAFLIALILFMANNVS